MPAPLIAALATAVPLLTAIPAAAASGPARLPRPGRRRPSPAAPARRSRAPVHQGTLRISGQPRDGALVTASGLAWHAPRLPRGMKLLSFEVAYTWQSCAPSGRHCAAAADSTATPFAARQYRAGHADTGRRLRVTETAAEVVQTRARDFTFRVLRRSVSRLAGVPRPRVPAASAPGYLFPQRPSGEAHRLGRRVFPGQRRALQHRRRKARPAVPGGPGPVAAGAG